MKNKIRTKSNFNKNLIKIRKEKSLSQEQLAQISGLSQRMIAYYEKEAINPPLDKIEIIAKALNVGVNDLIQAKDINIIQDKFSQLDIKTLKKLDLILSLSKHDRHIIYMMAETFYKRSNKSKHPVETKN